MKKLLLLGAGINQLGTVRRIQAMHHQVIACDPNPHALAKSFSDEALLADAFDPDAVLQALGDNIIDGVLCVATDQALKTSAIIAERRNLPSFLTPEQAHLFTNKAAMKSLFQQAKLPHLPWQLLHSPKDDITVEGPWVIKPLDSQGQRGIFLVNEKEELPALFPRVLKYSREKQVMLEHYLPCEEVTFNAWVHEGELIPLALSDRQRFADHEHLGVCTGHRHPSIFQGGHGETILELSRQITRHFDLQAGPAYYQFLIRDHEIFINEVAARIGGAFEEKAIPHQSGVDILELNILGALGERPRPPLVKRSGKSLQVALLFAKAGMLQRILKPPSFPGLLELHLPASGSLLPAIEHAGARVGHFILEAEDSELEKKLHELYHAIALLNEEGEDLLLRPPIEADRF